MHQQSMQRIPRGNRASPIAVSACLTKEVLVIMNGPYLSTELSHQAYWVLQRFRRLPLRMFLAILVYDNHPLLPDEEVFPSLFSRGKGSLGKRVRGLIGRSHCYLAGRI